MKKGLIVVVLMLASGWSVYGQQVSANDRPLSLKECVDIALQNNLQVRRSIYSVQNSNINLWQSKAQFLPTLNAGTSYGWQWGRAINPVTNIYTNRNGNNLNGQLSTSWLLFNGLRVQNNYKMSLRDFDASNYDLQKTKNDVIINVVTLYINVIFNKELYENANFQLKSSQTQLERIVKQVEAGSLPKANQLNQEAQVATNEVNLINQENAVNLSLLQLKQALQLPSSTPLDVIVPELSTEDLILEQGPDEIFQTALETMPEIRSAMLRVESADFALKASKGNIYPRLSINGSLQSNYSSVSDEDRPIAIDQAVPTRPSASPTGVAIVAQPSGDLYFPVHALVPNVTEYSDGYGPRDQLKDNLFKTSTLTLTVPLFNGLQTRSAVQRAAVNTELARINQIEAENTLRQTIETSYNDAVAAAKTYTSSLKQVSAREEAARMNQQRFELGAISFVENQISENDLFQARSDLTRAKYNFIFRKKILDFYQGKPIEY
jgi:outer membrane protein